MYDKNKEIKVGIRGQAMVQDVQPRENVTCILVDLDDPFWLMLVDKPCTVVVESFTDAWRNSFHAGDIVIRRF